MALQDVFDPAIEPLDHAVCLRSHWWCEAMLNAEISAKLIELMLSRSRALAQAKSRSVKASPLSVSTRVIFIGGARTRSRRQRRALAAVCVG